MYKIKEIELYLLMDLARRRDRMAQAEQWSAMYGYDNDIDVLLHTIKSRAEETE